MPGAIVSGAHAEPGYYEDGAFGIRLENVVEVVQAPTDFVFDDKPFLTFDTLTMVSRSAHAASSARW